MIKESISCPHCGKTVLLSEAISREVDAKVHEEIHIRQNELKEKYESDLRVAVNEATQAARAAATTELALEVETLKDQLLEREGKLRTARTLEITLRRERQELEEEKAELSLRVARELDQKRREIVETTRKNAAEEHTLILREKDLLLEQMRKQIANLKRKAEQGSQQIQGEVLELDLEERLRAMFPLDSFKPVPKGVNGADLIQEVCDRAGEICGVMLWETKRTKNWSDSWLGKLKADQLVAKADVALLLTQALPNGCERFQQIDGLWVTSQACAFDLAFVLRKSLIELASARRMVRGKSEKMEIVFDYISSPLFAMRVESILSQLVSFKGDLEAEKRAFSRIWARRETQIEAVVGSMAHIVGDLHAIADLSLAEVESLNLSLSEPEDIAPPLLEARSNANFPSRHSID